MRSIVASLVLTALLNIVPRLFPAQTRKARVRIAERLEGTFNAPDSDPRGSRVRVFFPWKAMLAISIGLTIALNLVAYFLN